MNVFSGVPSGISTSPVFFTLPTSEKTFVPELFGLPVSVNQAGPRVTMGAMLYQVSTLLMLVGFPHKPFLRRERRPRSRSPGFSFQRRDQRGLFAADKRSRALHQLDIELESATENVLAQQSVFARLFDARDSGGAPPADTRRAHR